MRRRVNLLELRDRDLGVNLGGRELRVPEHRLNEPDVGPVLQHVRRAGVPEEVTGTRRGDARVGDVAFHHVPEPMLLEALAEVGEEERAVVTGDRKRGSYIG